VQSPRHFLILLLTLACPAIAAPDADNSAIPIWPKGAPGSERHAAEQEQLEAGAYIHNVHRPSLTVSRPQPGRANGAAVVIIPGGGHRMLVFQNEGMVPARALNRYGITSFVLKYRLAREPGSTYTVEGDAAADARRAIRWVRAHAKDYGIDPRRIGVMGFSAGGELVTLVADNPAPTATLPADAVDRVSSRPDFQVLVYPGPLGTPAKSVIGAPPLSSLPVRSIAAARRRRSHCTPNFGMPVCLRNSTCSRARIMASTSPCTTTASRSSTGQIASPTG
jgi:acetyl esterase/lipase